ncbi:MAG: hypothetical protein MHM6MM_008299 [Cercozoa sp. M6MM]
MDRSRPADSSQGARCSCPARSKRVITNESLASLLRKLGVDVSTLEPRLLRDMSIRDGAEEGTSPTQHRHSLSLIDDTEADEVEVVVRNLEIVCGWLAEFHRSTTVLAKETVHSQQRHVAPLSQLLQEELTHFQHALEQAQQEESQVRVQLDELAQKAATAKRSASTAAELHFAQKDDIDAHLAQARERRALMWKTLEKVLECRGIYTRHCREIAKAQTELARHHIARDTDLLLRCFASLQFSASARRQQALDAAEALKRLQAQHAEQSRQLDDVLQVYQAIRSRIADLVEMFWI